MRRLLAGVGLWVLVAATASAQPNCRSVILPEPAAPSATTITHHIYYAPAPTAAELWGHITYPIGYRYLHAASTTNVGLMYLVARTFKVEGWQAQAWGWHWLDRTRTYVVGQSGTLYPYVPDGIRFVWYHNLPTPDAATESQQAPNFRITVDAGDGVGVTTALSTVMQRGESVSLGVNVLYPYPEPIRTEVALHLRECQ